jgi:hypothetical protein
MFVAGLYVRTLSFAASGWPGENETTKAVSCWKYLHTAAGCFAASGWPGENETTKAVSCWKYLHTAAGCCCCVQVRRTPRVWNKGDSRLKFILLCHKQYRPTDSTSGSNDDNELENTKQAGWVAARERSPQASAHGSHHSHPSSFTDSQ